MGIYEELQARGLIAQVTDEEEIRDLINNGKAVFYIGFDPTADSLHVGHFTSTETKRYFYFISLCNKFSGSINFGIQIICFNIWRKAYFLELYHLLLFSGFFFFSGQFITILAIVDNFAYRRFRGRSNLYQIKFCLLRKPHCFFCGHDSKLLTLGADQADLFVIDGFIQFMHLLTNGRNTSVPKITKRGYQTGTRATTNCLPAV